MSEELQELAGRLVVGRKSDGRSVYDEAAKAELVLLCGHPGASVSRLAREVGINANQLSRWIRERSQRRQSAAATAVVARESFIAVPVVTPSADANLPTARTSLQARLPNGVVLDLQDVELSEVVRLLEALGRMRCSASTKS
jgi:transposase